MKKEKEKMLKEISKKYGNSEINDAKKNWKSYGDDKKKSILQESEDIFLELAELKDKDVDSIEVQEIMVRWHNFIKNFYNPSIEVLRGLGNMYYNDPRFNKKFREIDPDLPDFLNEAIKKYVDTLEDRWLEEQRDILTNKLSN